MANNSAIASPNMYSITFSKSELDEQRKNAEENEITLGKSILENNKIPKLLITILKLDLKKYMAEKDPSGTKEYLLSLPELYTLNLVLPPTRFTCIAAYTLIYVPVDLTQGTFTCIF